MSGAKMTAATRARFEREAAKAFAWGLSIALDGGGLPDVPGWTPDTDPGDTAGGAALGHGIALGRSIRSGDHTVRPLPSESDCESSPSRVSCEPGCFTLDPAAWCNLCQRQLAPAYRCGSQPRGVRAWWE